MSRELRSLRDLAVAAADAHPGVSDRELGRRATDAGHRLVGTTLSAIKAGTYKSQPKPQTVEALAWLAGVGRERAYAAAGLYFTDQPFAADLPPEADRLTPKQRAAVIGVIRALLDPGVPAAGEDQVPGATSTEQEGDEAEERDERLDELLSRRRTRATVDETLGEAPAAARYVPGYEGERLAQEAGERGEESQDPGGDDAV